MEPEDEIKSSDWNMGHIAPGRPACPYMHAVVNPFQRLEYLRACAVVTSIG